MPVNIYERAIQPVVDLDTDVVVYVPGYAVKGPSEPTLVTAANFEALFGDQPYCFKKNQTDCAIEKNRSYAGRPEKSWLYAKGLTDAGLTVLYHRCNPRNIGVAETNKKIGIFVGSRKQYKLGDRYGELALVAKAVNFGSYYSGITISFEHAQVPNGLMTIKVKRGETVLESATVSLDPSKNSFIGNTSFSFIKFYVRFAEKTDTAEAEDYEGFDVLGLDEWYATDAAKESALYLSPFEETEIKSVKARSGDTVETETMTVNYLDSVDLFLETKKDTNGKEEDEFTVKEFEELLAEADIFKECEDTEKYQSITYITTGGYYQSPEVAATLQKLAYKIKSIALIELPDTLSVDTIEGYRSTLLSLASTTIEKSKSTAYVGADTFTIGSKRVVLPDGYGYLEKLASNLSQGIPAWIPVANNPQGVVSAQATTRPISNELRSLMTVNEGVSINPIIYKQNAGYTIMGNRTLFPTDAVPGPDSYLNCQLVVNSVLRSARRNANQLLIVSTNASTAFSKFKSGVSKTCDKMLVNGDGLAAYNITKLKKTQPGTIDILIELTVVEGIETFNITCTYQLQLDE